MVDLKPCPFCGGKAHFDHDDAGWNWIECSQCHASSTAAAHTGEDCQLMLRERWNRRETPDGAPAAPAAQPVAWVPIHPRTGPLWAMTTHQPDPERLPGSYPLRPLAFADGVAPTRRFTGPGHLEETGYIPAGSTAERDGNAGVSGPDGQGKEAKTP